MDKNLTKTIFESVMPLYEADVMALNDSLAKNPEIGGEEYESSKKMVELLRKNGMEVEYPFDGIATAFFAKINPEKANRAALLVEYDALPGVGHACGHCASGSASILAALALNHVKDQLDFGIDVIGTPDEEYRGCKCKMADDGVFDGYDFAAMVHMSSFNVAKADFIALDARSFKFYGKPAHAAQAPEKGRNALNAARLFLDATDMMRQHIIPEARLHGYIKNGGSASNVVPEFTEIEFLSRAPQRKDLTDITNWVEECAQAAAMATRTRCEIEEIGWPFHDLYISKPGQALMEEIFAELDMPVIEDGAESTAGSSDIGNVDYRCPAFHPMASIEQDLLLHSHEFAQAMLDPSTHKAVVNSAKWLVTLVAKLYGDPQRMQEIKAAHKAYRG